MDSMQRLVENDVIARLSRRDPSLFTDNLEEHQAVLHRMGWIGNSPKAAERVAQYENITRQVVAEGATDVVLLGMGGSSLASLVLSEVFGPAEGHPRLHVLDTTSPVTVIELIGRLNPQTTWFLLSSKSGTTIEPLSLYAIFREWADAALGRPAAGKRFIVITDPGTPLEKLRQKDIMRIALPAPANIGGRFSALTAFGLMPAALLGVDVSELLTRSEAMERSCESPAEENPAAALASWIADAHAAGRDKLAVAASGRFASFALWVEQLIAESTGKHGTGVVPVPEYAMRTPSGFGSDRAVFVLRDADDAAAAKWAKAIRREGQPVFEIELGDPLDLGAEFVRWEYATAMLGYLLGINPFDEPDVAAAKAATLDVINGAELPHATADVEGVWVTYAGALAAPDAAPQDLAQALAPAIASLRESDYLALLVYLPYNETILESLRLAVVAAAGSLGRAVCLELGPRYLHSTGQLHKGGPDNGVFIMASARDREDLPVPRQHFSLAHLHRAQAEGDLLTLSSRGRRVMRLDLPDSSAATLQELGKALDTAASAHVLRP
jgi:transaldolase/glucose-6-phosphate isomerase